MSRPTRYALGAFLIVAGLAMLVLPGPGLLTLVAAARVLAPELPLAQRLVESLPTVPTARVR